MFCIFKSYCNKVNWWYLWFHVSVRLQNKMFVRTKKREKKKQWQLGQGRDKWADSVCDRDFRLICSCVCVCGRRAFVSGYWLLLNKATSERGGADSFLFDQVLLSFLHFIKLFLLIYQHLISLASLWACMGARLLFPPWQHALIINILDDCFIMSSVNTYLNWQTLPKTLLLLFLAISSWQALSILSG